MSPYSNLEDAPTSDTGFVAVGADLDECFRAAAEATLAVMLVNPETLQGSVERSATVRRESLELLLVGVLEEILFFKDAEALFLRAGDLHVNRTESGWEAVVRFEGEAIDPTRHRLGADVKAVTLHRLSVEPVGGAWRATVVLDV